MQIRRGQTIRRERLLRDYDNPLDYLHDDAIVRKHRFSRPMILNLCRMLENDLQRHTMRSRAFPVSLQIMMALRFYATGSFLLVNADVHIVSRSSVSRVIRDVANCLVSVCQQYITMPTDQANLQNIMQGFHNIANFPNVVGALDGTHIRIKTPSIDEHFYVNRKKQSFH